MSILFDLKLAERTLRRTPASAVIAAFALGLGIGLSTLVFSIVQGAMLRGLPLPESDEIVTVERFVPARSGVLWPSVHDIAAWRDARSFEGVGGYVLRTMNLSGRAADVPEQVSGAAVSAEVFPLLGVRPILGRLFLPEDDVEGAAPVAIIGERLWQRRFAGAASAIGATLRANGAEFEVVGVLPEDFAFPFSQEVWQPLRQQAARLTWGDAPAVQAVARLRDGVTAKRAVAELDGISARLAAEHPETHEGTTARVRPFTEFSGQDRAMLFVMIAAVLAVLAISCVNVANLLIGRAIVRTKEVGIRKALGASRLRAALPFLAESVLLAVAGVLFGIFVAALGIRLFNRSVIPAEPPFWVHFGIDGQTLLFVALAGGLCALLAGVVPALQAAGLDLQDTLRDASRGASSFRLGRLSRGLVIAEIALSVGLLAGAGLLVRSVLELNTLDVGVPADEILTARVTLLGERWADVAARHGFYRDLEAGLASLPGVRAATLASALPGIGGGWSRLEIEGETVTDGPSTIVASNPVVSPGYFDLFDASPVKGRGFTASDDANSEPVAIVNEAFERRWMAERGALGRRVRLVGTEPWYAIVGVVPDLPESRAQDDRPEAYYRPLAQQATGFASLAIRAPAPMELVPALREQVRLLDPDLPVSAIGTLRTRIGDVNFRLGIFSGLFASFGFAALVLAAVGLYGVMSFSVGQRRREVGVRMAVGARPGDVLRLVVFDGMRQVALGLVIGVLLAFLLGRALSAALFRVSPQDPITFIGIIAILAAVALLACGIPGLRATRIDPIDALGTE